LLQIETVKKRIKEKTAQQIVDNPLSKIVDGHYEMISLLPFNHIEALLQLAEKDEKRINLVIF
jgi:hypothetical protein